MNVRHPIRFTMYSKKIILCSMKAHLPFFQNENLPERSGEEASEILLKTEESNEKSLCTILCQLGKFKMAGSEATKSLNKIN
jgi:hypothetical protein